MVTIFTPTYNRAYILPKLYDSLKSQSCKDFEWVVVDDGSTDGTFELLSNLQAEADFPIIYKKTENKGKMQAVNLGVTLAKGEYFWIVDSDDYLPCDGVEIVLKWFFSLPSSGQYAGVAGLRTSPSGLPLGSSFEGEYIDSTSLDRSRYGIYGDKSEVFFTTILKMFPFPYFEGEKFVPEGLIFNRISLSGYSFRWFNETCYICEYLQDGYTKNVNKNLITNWKGYSLYVKELLQSPTSKKDKLLIGGAYCLRAIRKLTGWY